MIFGSCFQRNKSGWVSPLTLPLKHAKGTPNEGSFRTTLRLGGIDFDLVIDTCSHLMLVVSDKCSGCLQDRGIWPTSKPVDLHHELYVSFAMQTNIVHLYKSNLSLGGSEVPIKFGATISNRTTHQPGMAILGLYNKQDINAPDGHGLLESDNFALIGQLFGSNGVFEQPKYSIRIDPDGNTGELLLGGYHEGIVGWVKLLTVKEVPILNRRPEMLVNVVRMEVMKNDGNVAFTYGVDRMRVDTGNTWFTLPDSNTLELRDLIKSSTLDSIRITLENNITICIPKDMFLRPFGEALSTGFGRLVINQNLPTNMCVLGNEVMRGMTLAVDLLKGQLGLGGMCISNQPSRSCSCTVSIG